MGFQCGIVGLPNVGKSTIFNALTSAKAEAANFPFCTIEPNTGVVKVPDPRLEKISQFIPTQQVIPATMKFVDIAGLVKGASQGEGLGNQFLGHIRETQALAHVVRCFSDSEVVHVDGSVDPVRDIEVIDTELILADLETIGKRFDGIAKVARAGNKEAAAVFGVLQKVRTALNEGKPVRSLGLEKEEFHLIRDFHLITAKKVMYIANVDEPVDSQSIENNDFFRATQDHAQKENSVVVPVCGKIESEISELADEEKLEFLKDYHMSEPGLNRVIRAGYDLLGLSTYFTAGEKEIRAWTIRKGAKAPEAAGAIHSDFERGFIKAEVYHFDALMEHHSTQSIRDSGALRLEGKEYQVKDGDIMLFRFSV